MLTPNVTSHIVPTAGSQTVRITSPGAGQTIPSVFCAWGTYSNGVTSISVTLTDGSGTTLFTGSAKFNPTYNLWYCQVNLSSTPSSSSSSSPSGSSSSSVSPSSSSSSGSSSPSGSSSSSVSPSSSSSSGPSLASPSLASVSSIAMATTAAGTVPTMALTATPNIGTGDQKTGIVLDASQMAQTCANFDGASAGGGAASPTAVTTSTVSTTTITRYVSFPFEYPDPSDPAAPLYEVIAGAWDHKNNQGNVVTYHYPPLFTPNPTKTRTYWVPYYGPGIYYAQFTRVEAFGPVVESQIFVKLEG